MAVPFDHINFTYNRGFAEGFIERLQRRYVWMYLEKITPELKGYDILELNCGGGDDAILFGEEGFNIVATDVSEVMLQATQEKTKKVSLQNRICSHYIDPESFDETVFDKKFNLIFVNFGGLNSIHPNLLQRMLQKVPAMLADKGRFIAVTVPRFSLREIIHFLLQFEFKKAMNAFRERHTSALNTAIKKWFHTPEQIRQWTKEKFRLITLQPVGHVRKYSLLTEPGDNFLIDLQLK